MANLRNISTRSSNRKLFRAASLLAAAWLLGGCNIVGGDAKSFLVLANNAWTGKWTNNPNHKVTLQQAAAVPYASMGISLGDSGQSMIILASDTGGERLWTSKARIAITTASDGRIVRTAGLEHDLGGYEPRGDTMGADGVRTVRWEADFPELNLHSILISCQDRVAGNETIYILGKPIHTQRIDESCASTDSRLDWSFENRYWVDIGNGLVWRSIQHVNPKLDAIETEILRPPV
jgi:hypothetical protein